MTDTSTNPRFLELHRLVGPYGDLAGDPGPWIGAPGIPRERPASCGPKVRKRSPACRWRGSWGGIVRSRS